MIIHLADADGILGLKEAGVVIAPHGVVACCEVGWIHLEIAWNPVIFVKFVSHLQMSLRANY